MPCETAFYTLALMSIVCVPFHVVCRREIDALRYRTFNAVLEGRLYACERVLSIVDVEYEYGVV